MPSPALPHVPNHVGLIPDGTRRWAIETGAGLDHAYRLTMDKVVQFVSLFFGFGSRSVTVYLASSDNLSRRSEAEIQAFVDAERELVEFKLADLIDRYDVRIKHAGTTRRLPARFREALGALENRTSKNEGKKLFLCIDYDPFDEIAACIAPKIEHRTLVSHLWVNESVDLVIRTGGKTRLSNFLPLQSAYAELIFLSRPIPECTEEEIMMVLKSFSSSGRRFGA